MPQDAETDSSPYSPRMFFAPFLAAVAFGGLAMVLQDFFPKISPGVRLCFQASIAACVVLLVMRFWRRKPPARPAVIFGTGALHTVLLCSWWAFMAAWCVGVEAETGLFGPPLTPIIDHLATSTFPVAFICAAAATLVLGLLDRRGKPPLWQVLRGLVLLILLFAPVIAAFYLSAYPVRAAIKDASPGLVVCLRVVIALVVFLAVARGLAAVMRVQPEATETLKTRSKPLRIVLQIAALSFLGSFFVLIYIGANLRNQPDHRTGEYTVSERFKYGDVRYMTVSRSATTNIATWTLLGSVAAIFALNYLVQRRAKKLVPLARPPTSGP